MFKSSVIIVFIVIYISFYQNLSHILPHSQSIQSQPNKPIDMYITLEQAFDNRTSPSLNKMGLKSTEKQRFKFGSKKERQKF